MAILLNLFLGFRQNTISSAFLIKCSILCIQFKDTFVNNGMIKTPALGGVLPYLGSLYLHLTWSMSIVYLLYFIILFNVMWIYNRFKHFLIFTFKICFTLYLFIFCSGILIFVHYGMRVRPPRLNLWFRMLFRDCHFLSLILGTVFSFRHFYNS